MSISQPILNHENIPNDLWDKNIHTLKSGQNNGGNYPYVWS